MGFMSSPRWWAAVGKGIAKEGPISVLRAASWAVARRVRASVRPAVPAAAESSAARPFPMLCWQLEEPDVTQPSDPALFRVRGWIAAPGPVEDLGFRDEPARSLLKFEVTDRPEVAAVYNMPAVNFVATCPYDAVRGRGPFTLTFRADGGEHEIVVPTHRPTRERSTLKGEKLTRIEALLRCPVCTWEQMNVEPAYVQCRRCRTQFPRDALRFDFLTEELRKRFAIAPTSNVSASVYDGEAQNIIYRNAGGLVLDCGAGLRDRYFPNVVNFEIVPYDTTDVVGAGESLPFKDASFDAVLSFAVLEHVKDAFACARELLRVLKPGGKLYCQVPFLQPLHGYPNHYYNMTVEGMRNLFGDALRVETAGPFVFGQPVFALTWILNRYVEGLPVEQREAFRRLRLEDLMQPGESYLGRDFVRALAPAAREELSCCNAIVATKMK